MFRSLLIGFLILSALTSKGAGIQIADTNLISADMLLEFFNSVSAQTAKNAELSPAAADRALAACALSNGRAVLPFPGISSKSTFFVWCDPINRTNFRAGFSDICPEQMSLYRSGAFLLVSGLSPPHAGCVLYRA